MSIAYNWLELLRLFPKAGDIFWKQQMLQFHAQQLLELWCRAVS